MDVSRWATAAAPDERRIAHIVADLAECPRGRRRGADATTRRATRRAARTAGSHRRAPDQASELAACVRRGRRGAVTNDRKVADGSEDALPGLGRAARRHVVLAQVRVGRVPRAAAGRARGTRSAAPLVVGVVNAGGGVDGGAGRRAAPRGSGACRSGAPSRGPRTARRPPPRRGARVPCRAGATRSSPRAAGAARSARRTVAGTRRVPLAGADAAHFVVCVCLAAKSRTAFSTAPRTRAGAGNLVCALLIDRRRFHAFTRRD